MTRSRDSGNAIVLEQVRGDAKRHVRQAVLDRVDRYIEHARKGGALVGVRLRGERCSSADSHRVGGLPGLYWGDVAVPIGLAAGEPSPAA